MEAYPVPFVVDRSATPRLRLRNIGRERLRGVTVTVHGRGVMAVSPVAVLAPMDELEVHVRGRDLELDSSIVVRWLRPDDAEYLWRVVF